MEPQPTRRRVRKRWVIPLILVLLAILSHFVWTMRARSALDEQAAAHRAAGEPIEPKDFAVTGVADKDNAVLPLRAAAAALDRGSKAWKTFTDSYEPPALPLRTEEHGLLRQIVSSNPGVVPHVRAATTKPTVDWQVVIPSPAILLPMDELGDARAVANFLMLDALLAHTDADHARALERMGDLLFVAQVVGRRPLIISGLVSVGIHTMAAERTSELAIELRIASDEPRAASHMHVRDFIARLLDERDLAESQRYALMGERMTQLDLARTFVPGIRQSFGGSAGRAIIRPLILNDGLLMMRYTTGVMEAAVTSDSLPDFKRRVPAIPANVRERAWMHLLASMFLQSMDRPITSYYRARTSRRLAATALAVRLYAVEHDGGLPEKLDDLVPGYLPAVPRDPMAPTTQPLRYRAHPKPILYSVGDNGVDERGSEEPVPNRPNPYGRNRWAERDFVVDLTPQPRPAPVEIDDGVGGFSKTIAPQSTTIPMH